jgi:hypothetical protein
MMMYGCMSDLPHTVGRQARCWGERQLWGDYDLVGLCCVSLWSMQCMRPRLHALVVTNTQPPMTFE